MTNEQWDTIKENWHYQYQFSFLIDGYNLILQKGIDKKGKIYYTVYVNGYLDFKLADKEEGKRFFKLRTKSFYTAKQKKEWQKIPGKREYNKEKSHYEKKHINHFPFWNNFNSFKKHIIKNNKSIELKIND